MEVQLGRRERSDEGARGRGRLFRVVDGDGQRCLGASRTQVKDRGGGRQRQAARSPRAQACRCSGSFQSGRGV